MGKQSRKVERHLERVAPDAPERPTPVGFPVTIEIPTGGRRDVDGLIRELARAVFRGQLRGYEVKADGPSVRYFLSVQPMSDFGPEEVAEGQRAILRALVQVGVLKLKPTAAPAAPDPNPDADNSVPGSSPEDGTECPPSSPAS